MSYYIRNSASPQGTFMYEDLVAFVAAVEDLGRTCLPLSTEYQWQDLRGYLSTNTMATFKQGVLLHVDSEDSGFIGFCRSEYEKQAGVPVVTTEDILGRNNL